MLLSLLFVRYVVRDDIGHGVTKVLFSISRNNSRIRSHNMWSSLLSSSVTIGFGGSVGAEAPIVYTGAAIGSNVARSLGLSYRQMTILLCCGAAGAVAGIFKAPMAGILFCLEILLFNISMSSILPLLLSSVTATTVSYLFLGREVPFTSTVDAFAMGNIPYYILLGLLCGFVSLYFLRTTLSLEDRIKKINNPFKRWAVCASMLGVLIFLFPPLFGEGYDSLGHMLQGHPDSVLESGLSAGQFRVCGDIPVQMGNSHIFCPGPGPEGLRDVLYQCGRRCRRNFRPDSDCRRYCRLHIGPNHQPDGFSCSAEPST